MNQTRHNHLAELNQEFATALGDSLRSAGSTLNAGQAWESQLSGESTSRLKEALTVALQLGGDLSGEVFLSVDEEAAETLLPQPAPGASGNAPEAWLELVKASKRAMEEALEPAFGTVRVEGYRLAAQPTGLTPLPGLMLRGSGATSRAAIDLHTDASLRGGFERLAAATRAIENNTGSEAAAGKGNLERVIDVPLAVTLRFGQRQLTLRELLALTTGSLVELDRQVEEPVDLVLGERVIARGEVVIVDGNYGMRVLEVVESPEHSMHGPAAASLIEQSRAREVQA